MKPRRTTEVSEPAARWSPPARWPPPAGWPLPARCGGRCQPRWKLPNLPYLWLCLASMPALFFVLVGLVALVAPPGSVDAWGDRLAACGVAILFAAPLATPVALWSHRLHRARRRVLAGRRVPVTVYYGRLFGAFPVAPRPRFRLLAAPAGDVFTQPLLLLAAADGRIWTARPDAVSDHSRTSSTNRNNPWIAPLLARHSDGGTVVDPTTAWGRQLPVDLDADGNRAVLDALRHLGRPEPHDPPESRGADLYRNHPRTYGGPVPGELVLAPDGRYHGLVLHRPADAPATVPLAKRYWTVEYHYFGTDPGLCCGLYLTELAALTPHLSR